ncbi:MAG: hypothetical protein AMXMBFR81_22990 [Chthonomonas sp.]
MDLFLSLVATIALGSLFAAWMTLTDRPALVRAVRRAEEFRERHWRQVQFEHRPIPRPVPRRLDAILEETERHRRAILVAGAPAVPTPAHPVNVDEVPPLHLYRLATPLEFAGATLRGWWAADGAEWSSARPVPTEPHTFVMRVSANQAVAAGVEAHRQGVLWVLGDVPAEFIDRNWSDQELRARLG